MKQNILITSALLYANGSLHFGHISGAYLPADCYARYKRFSGHPTLFVCGSDEYGAAVTLSASRAGHTPKEHVDSYHEKAQEDFKRFDISFDHYSRTTWEGHDETVIEFFNDLSKNGYVEKKTTSQLYSENEKTFLADRYVVGECPECHFENARGDECPKCAASYESTSLINPKSKESGSKLILKETEHYFFKLDMLKSELKSWILKKDWKPQVVNMAIKYIEDAHARSITRDLKWGIQVPNHPDKVFYVWFDAPIGYISASKEWAQKINDPDKWKDFWLNESTKYVQFIGKDNIPFHSVFFPAMVMGQDKPYKQVDELPANSFFHYEGKKFSKSDNWFIELDSFFEKFDSDVIRYYLMANAPETADSEFVWKEFQAKVNSDLVGKLGNFVNRTLSFLVNKIEPKIPAQGKRLEKDEVFLKEIKEKSQEILKAYDGFHLRKALAHLMELCTLGNVYFDEMKPWALIKEDTDRTKEVLRNCLEAIKHIAICAYPITPKASQKIWKMLGFDGAIESQDLSTRLSQDLVESVTLEKPQILFQKIEDKVIDLELEKLNKGNKMNAEIESNEIDFDTFMKIDLRVAQILEVEEVPKSKKLFKLLVDLGDEKRVVVSGIKNHYSPEDLVGKKIVFVANLKPAKIMGVKSHGMILAGSDEDQLEVLNIENLKLGSKVS